MKNYIRLSVAMLILCCMAACSKVTVLESSEDSGVYTVKLGWDGDILEVLEEPMSRANDENDLYAIQVYSTPNKEDNVGNKVTWTPFAYGLFDQGKDISINLLKGYRYKFVATMVVDGKTKVQTSTNNGKLGYYHPFHSDNTTTPVNNQFDYQSSIYFGGLASGSTFIKNPSGIYSISNTKRFYGEYIDYIPGLKNNERVMIKMKTASFQATFHAKGKLAKEGQLEVQITDAPKILIDLTNTEKSHSDIYTFKNVKAASENNTYTETHDVTINWHKPDGTIFPLGTHEITYKTNKNKVLNITINTDSSPNGIGLEIEDSEITDDEDEITIEDGEIVETEIDTNA